METKLTETAGLIISLAVAYLLTLGSLHTQDQRITILCAGVFLTAVTMVVARFQASEG